MKKASWKAMEQHIHECINDIIKNQQPPAEKYSHLQKYKAKLIRHHAEYKRHILKDVSERDRGTDQEPTLFHSLRQRGGKQAKPFYKSWTNKGSSTTPPVVSATPSANTHETNFNAYKQMHMLCKTHYVQYTRPTHKLMPTLWNELSACTKSNGWCKQELNTDRP
jgi:hypothetical protein